jgi:hypothetical protein
MTEDEKINAVGKLLGEPVAPELSPVGLKVRNHLFIVCVISITVVLANLRISPESTFLGLKFTGVDDSILRYGLLILLGYFTFHFSWIAFDSFLEWRLRITGTRVTFVTTGLLSDEKMDYPNDPRQSTLYNWWKYQANQIGNLSREITKTKEIVETLQSDLKERYTTGADAMNIVNACTRLSEVLPTLQQVQNAITSATETIGSDRIPTSLKRFDNWFELFIRSQNLRWLVIDILLPISLSGYALFLLIGSI